MAERDWNQRGKLPKGTRPTAVAVSADGYGLIAVVLEPESGTATDQLRGRKAQLFRATTAGLEPVYDGAGWIVALDGQGASWFAVGATLKASGSGSDYRLLRSTDSGKTWQGRGTLPATSVAQVLAVTQNEAWALGATTLTRTLDGGTSWGPATLEGERNPHTERLRRSDRMVALLGQGFALTQDAGHTWSRDLAGGTRVVDLDGRLVAAVKDGQRALVGRRGPAGIEWIAELPADRLPLRIASVGDTVRVFTRALDPSQGAGITLFRSEDAGKSWTALALALRPEADLAGDCGLGVDLQGQVFGPL